MTEAWMIMRWDRNVDHIDYRLDEYEGVWLDRDLAEARVAELNQAERTKDEQKNEQDYQDRLATWRRQRADYDILLAAGARQGPFALAEPRRYAFTRTIDEYRLSDPLDLHTREEA